MRSRRLRVAVVVVLAALALAGCSNHRHDNTDLDALLAAYREQEQRLVAKREEMLEQGIETLEVEPGSRPEESLVSVDLVEARLGVVVERILGAVGLEYVTGSPRLLGTISARFEDRPLIEALRLLLRPRGLTAGLEDGVLVFSASQESPVENGPPEEPLAMEVPLRWVKTDRATDILDSLFPMDEDSGLRDVLFAARTETNSILLSGERRHVDRAIRLLSDLDTDPGHIMLEALVVEFNVQSFLDIGARLEDGAKNTLSDIFFDVADLVGDTISFTRVSDAANTTQFRAVLNLLFQTEDARIVSRPYVAAVSGSRAHLEIAEDRFIVVETPGDIDVTLESISSGVIVDLLPILTADGSILLDIGIDESQFVPTLENVEQRRARNTVTTFAHVESGQTVIIGGLMLRARSQSIAGIPWIRRIPPFSMFLGHEDYSHQDSQVMIFITPHIWQPGMDTPLAAQEHFQVYPEFHGEDLEKAEEHERGRDGSDHGAAPSPP